MGSAHLQCVFQTQADLVNAPSRFDRREGLPNVHEVAKVTAFDKLHREIVEAAFVTDVQNRHDIGMDKLLANPGFSFKAGHRPRIIDPPFTEQFQGDNAVVVRRSRAEDASKTA